MERRENGLTDVVDNSALEGLELLEVRVWDGCGETLGKRCGSGQVTSLRTAASCTLRRESKCCPTWPPAFEECGSELVSRSTQQYCGIGAHRSRSRRPHTSSHRHR